MTGIEPATCGLQSHRSPKLSYIPESLMGLSGVEPLTSRLSGARSNQLSYRPSSTGPMIQNSYHRPIKALYNSKHGQKLFRPKQWSTSARQKILPAVNLLRKEVIQPQLPLRLPCYDLAPVIGFTLGAALLAVKQTTSGAPNFRGLTGGVYKARERIHRSMLICDY
jgi:hypothetical protein